MSGRRIIGLTVLGVLAVMFALVWSVYDPAPTRATFDRRAEQVLRDLERSEVEMDTSIEYCVDDSPPMLLVSVEDTPAQTALAESVRSRWLVEPSPDGYEKYRHDFGDWEAVLRVGRTGGEHGLSVTLDEGQQTGCAI